MRRFKITAVKEGRFDETHFIRQHDEAIEGIGTRTETWQQKGARLRTGSIACAIKLEMPMHAASSRRAQKATARPMGPALLTETHPLRKSNAHATLCWRMQFKKEKPA